MIDQFVRGMSDQLLGEVEGHHMGICGMADQHVGCVVCQHLWCVVDQHVGGVLVS